MTARVKRFVKLWVDLFNDHELLDHASAISFAVLKALVPLTLLGIAVLGVAGQRHVWRNTMFPALKPHVQPATANAIDTAVEKIFSQDSIGLLVFASLMALWYISGSVRGVMGATNVIYEREETRSWKERYPLSVGLAAGIAACLIASVLAVLAGPAVFSSGALGVVVDIGRWLVAAVLLTVAVSLLFRYAPVEPRSKGWISGGSILVMLAWIAASMVFRVLVTSLLNFKTATGSLAVFLVLCGYIYTSSIIFLVGVEVDELLRADAVKGERGLLESLGIAR
jgi:membrane protein